MSEINVVPYIDVMLVLLIIFMITAPLLTQGVKVELPQAESESMQSDSEEKEPLVVTVNAEGNYFLNVGDDIETPVDNDLLVARVSAVLRRKPGTPVMVRGDKNVNYGKVIIAMTLLQKAGSPSVGLITESPEPTGKK
ncbi:MAG: protein TolR [Gammaproteobacteria bacterium]|nr:protein TolR [Gammaproteobacteria bacterium]